MQPLQFIENLKNDTAAREKLLNQMKEEFGQERKGKCQELGVHGIHMTSGGFLRYTIDRT